MPRIPENPQGFQSVRLWRVMKKLIALVVVLCPWIAPAQTTLQYHLSYPAAGSSAVQVRIDLPLPGSAPLTLVIPRNYPGGYGLVLYDSFVEDVRAFSEQGKPLAVKRDPNGPRWSLGAAGEKLARVEYSVNVERMEAQIHDAVATSKIRSRYAGLFGYSVFAYIDGMETASIALQIDGPPDWPVFSTISPAVPAPLHSGSVAAANYYALADNEVLMGPGLQLQRFDGAIAMVMAVYAEGDADFAAQTEMARTALDRVQRYFGDEPFPVYTVQREVLKPLPGHDYHLSQEHLSSGTFIASTEDPPAARATPQQRENNLINYAHHIAHSWVPKRAYGEGYMPFLWEMPPVIDTIWFNEGFGRYAGIAALADGLPKQEGEDFRRRHLANLQRIIDNAPDFIRRMPTVVLSQEASFLYAIDFRTGRNIFARGALMAAEMDDRIRLQTQGRQSLRDALRAIVLRTQQLQRPFRIDELAPAFKQTTGVEVDDILQRWLQPSAH
jgi:predicted metalloprotease with PDZ domain